MDYKKMMGYDEKKKTSKPKKNKVMESIKEEFGYKEDIKAGLSNAPSAFIDLLNGRNFGKLLVKVSD